MSTLDYWKECLSTAAEDCGLKLTPEQLTTLAEGVEGGHENYGMAFYSPPSTDRLHQIEREHKAKVGRMEKDHERYVANAEEAVKRALRQRSDERVSIGEHGQVFRHGGRTLRAAALRSANDQSCKITYTSSANRGPLLGVGCRVWFAVCASTSRNTAGLAVYLAENGNSGGPTRAMNTYGSTWTTGRRKGSAPEVAPSGSNSPRHSHAKTTLRLTTQIQ